jgi:hypothetical protein
MNPSWTYWISHGRLLAGPYPGEDADEVSKDTTQERIDALLEAGIRSFLDLTEPGLWKPYQPHLPPEALYLRSAIPDWGVPGTPQQMREILDHIRASLAAARPVYVHCYLGVGRTGTVAGCWLAEAGFQGEEALAELNRLWQQSVLSGSIRQIPPAPQQRDYVRGWPGRG